MVICQYFSTGCHFGKKCLNEHIDLKHLIKTEIEAALNGKQWPLSCFSALKEKQSLPNFVEDQSFEEIRLLFYNGKAQGNIQQIQMNFYNLVQEAKAKMQTYTTLSNEAILSIIRMYNNVPDPQTNYGKQQPFTTNTSPSTANIFGPTQDFSATPQSVFGNQNVFGVNKPLTNVQTVPSMNTFALPQIGQQQQSQSTGNIFGTQPPPGFGSAINPNQTTNIFASMNNQIGGTTFPNTSNQLQQSPFSNNALGTTMIPNNQNNFGQVVQPQQSTGMSFSQSGMQQQQSPFAAAPFNQPIFQNLPQQQSAIVANPSNVFGVGNTPASLHTTNIFGNSTPAPSISQQQQSIFGRTAEVNPVNQPFGQIQTQQSSIFGAGNNSNEIKLPDTIYSKITDLSPEDIEAFSSEDFVMGKIPNKPPPKEIC